MKLVMTLKVRDEADVVGHNLRFHRAMGVDHFIALDNASVDGTSEILARWQAAGLATVLRDDSDDLRSLGAGWFTQMARMAATEHGADWVFNNDADEFWWPLEGTLKDVLATIPERYGAVVCPRTEFAPRPDGPGSFADRLTLRERLSTLQSKVIHRGDPGVVVLHRGAHDVAVAPDGDTWSALRPPGRAVHRSVRAAAEGDGAGRDALVWAPSWPVRILHFPIRSFEQFRLRTEISMRSGGFREGGRFKRLRKAYEEGGLEEIYAEQVLNDEDAHTAIESGRMVEDRRLAELLPRCPDPPPGGEWQTVPVEPSAEAVAAERDALELDAMRLLARTERFSMVQIERMRERIDSLTAEREAEAPKRRRGLLGR